MSKKKKNYPDYLDCMIVPESGKWVSDHIIKGRRIAMYGIGVGISFDGKKVTLNPVIPALSPAIKLLQKYSAAQQIAWDRKKRKWKLA